MKKLYTILLALIITTGIGFSCEACKDKKYLQPVAAMQKSTPANQKPTLQTTSTGAQKTYITPLEILNNPNKYLNKPVYIVAKFDKFSTLGLDYTPAMRTSADYIAFLVQRNDITNHNIPLSEVKLILKRDYAEKFIDLDTGDKIHIDGRMFSNVLGDVWIDVDKIEAHIFLSLIHI